MAEEGMDIGWVWWMRHIGYDRGKEHCGGVMVKQCNSTFSSTQPALVYSQITQKCVDICLFNLLTTAIIKKYI